MGFKEWKQSLKLRRNERKLKRGKGTYGRQGITPVAPKVTGTVSARVYRAATDSWEDLSIDKVTMAGE